MPSRTRAVLIVSLLLGALALAILLFERGDEDKPAGKGEGEAASEQVPVASTETHSRKQASHRPVVAQTPASQATILLEESVELPFGSIAGLVKDLSTGEAVVGAELVFAGDDGHHSIFSDDKGRFFFVPNRLGGQRLVVARAQGYLDHAPNFETRALHIETRPQERIEGLVVTLVPAIDYLVQVESRSGEPLPGATVTLVHADTGAQAMAPLQDQFETDERGQVKVHARDFSLVRAEYLPRGQAEDKRMVGHGVIDHSAQLSHQLTIRVEEGKFSDKGIRGIVVDSQGTPIAGARVSARGGQGLDWHLPLETESDEHGRFVFDPRNFTGRSEGAPWRWTVRAEMNGYGAASAVADRGAELRLKLHDDRKIAGKVHNDSGEAITAFRIQVRSEHGLIVASESFFDSGGEFQIAELPPGPLSLLAIAEGYVPSSPVVAQGEESALRLTVGEGGSVYGQVVSSEGGPLEGARITTEGNGGDDELLAFLPTTLTDSQGRFEVHGMRPGLRTLRVAAFGHHLRLHSGIRVIAGERIGPIEVPLQATEEGETPGLETTGLGIAVSKTERGILVERVIETGGGFEAGLLAGDLLLSINGEALAEMSFEDAVQEMRGPVDTQVSLEVERSGSPRATVIVTRRKIRI